MRAPESLPEILDVAVVGAGFSGLGVSRELKRLGLSHSVLERRGVGDTWLSQRWDSFHTNIPNEQMVMPNEPYQGPDPEGFLTRDAFVALLRDYAARHRLPLRTATVGALEPDPAGFRLATPGGPVLARAVVAASGALTRPRRPACAATLPPDLPQIDAGAYRNPGALPDGAVLVVGNAQTGAQLAEELVLAGRRVYLATGRVGRTPRRYRGRDILHWLVASGLFDAPRSSFVGPDGRIAGRPTLAVPRTISLQSLSAEGVILLGHLVGFADGRLHFADDVADNIRFADDFSAASRARIDAYIAEAGIDAPPAEPDPAETVAPRLPDPPILALDPAAAGLGSVLWCTGFRGDFGWIRLPGALDADGEPVHQGGLSPIPGLAFAGLDFATTRRSGTILALAEEAPRLAAAMAAHLAAS